MFTVDDYIQAKRVGEPYAKKVGTEITLRNYRTALQMAERLLDKPIGHFTELDASRLMERSASYSQSMRNQMISALRGAFDWAIGTKRHEGGNPFLAVRQQTTARKLPRVLSVEEMDRLFAATEIEGGEKYALILSLMGYSGLRISEVLTLLRKNLTPDGLFITAKGQREAFVHVRPDILERLHTYAQQHQRSPYIFYGENGRLTNKPLGTAPVYRVLDRALKRAGLAEHVTPHTLRHSFAVHALRTTERIEVVQDLLRHQNLNTTRWYTQLTRGELGGQYASLWEVTTSEPAAQR